ncbi:MAG: response regulator [Alphaproteobacteria bacterium]|nr:response regulator [Alphaproteobacteria bacterium]
MAKILAVEDEYFVRSLVVETLADAGHSVLDAADGEEALAIVKDSPDIALIVTDVRMPRLDGFALARLARELRPGLAVLFMTGYTGASPPAELATAKMLNKPFAPEELVATVDAILSGG